MPEKTAIKVQIRNLFDEHLYVQIPKDDTDLIDEGLLDSLMLVDLLVRLEKEFGITVAMDQLDLDDFRTLLRITDYISRMVGDSDVNCTSLDQG
ncbi:MAG: acyl carrier protein [Mariniblastus sp.]|nr:acyl carrier protein [Mariniblastus sp.]